MEFIQFFDSCPNDFDDEVMDCIIYANKEITFGDKARLQNIVDTLKDELEDYQFDEIVSEACERYFESMGVEFGFVNVSATIEV